MMIIIRLWVLVIVLTAITWLVLKLAQKPQHIGLIFLFWVAVVLASTGVLYGFSVFLAGQ